jgi:hypothetical protein
MTPLKNQDPPPAPPPFFQLWVPIEDGARAPCALSKKAGAGRGEQNSGGVSSLTRLKDSYDSGGCLQTTCADCAGSLGGLLTPSPPAEKTAGRQE